MKEEIYNDGDLIIFTNDGRYYLRYDAGAHQVAIREDEISEEEMRMILDSTESATKVLFVLQERLKSLGITPYISNVNI